MYEKLSDNYMQQHEIFKTTEHLRVNRKIDVANLA